jgi:hypothetical protein
MTYANLWAEWTDKASGEKLKSCCMFTADVVIE